MQITAAVKRTGSEDFHLGSIEIDAPRADEVLVRIAGVGLCHTDLGIASSGQYPLPAVLGHEGSGIVELVGSEVSKVAVGDRVSITFRSCGSCARCDEGDAPYCRSFAELNLIGMRPDGSKALRDDEGDVSSNFFGQSSFATHALTYERNLVKLPEDVPLELMGPLGCGIQTGAGAVIRSLEAKPGSSILITGGGSVGLAAVMGACIQRCSTIILVEPMASRRELGTELGATHTIDPATSPDISATIRELVPHGVDYAVDTSGVPAVINSIIPSLGSKGVFGVIGLTPPGTPVPGELSSIMALGQTIRGIIEGDSDPDEFIPELVEHFKAGRLPFDRLIKTYPLSEINQAVKDQENGHCVKAVLIP